MWKSGKQEKRAKADASPSCFFGDYSADADAFVAYSDGFAEDILEASAQKAGNEKCQRKREKNKAQDQDDRVWFPGGTGSHGRRSVRGVPDCLRGRSGRCFYAVMNCSCRAGRDAPSAVDAFAVTHFFNVHRTGLNAGVALYAPRRINADPVQLYRLEE